MTCFAKGRAHGWCAGFRTSRSDAGCLGRVPWHSRGHGLQPCRLCRAHVPAGGGQQRLRPLGAGPLRLLVRTACHVTAGSTYPDGKPRAAQRTHCLVACRAPRKLVLLQMASSGAQYGPERRRRALGAHGGHLCPASCLVLSACWCWPSGVSV